MGFLAPAFLALAAFAGVPLLVHLLRRRVARTVDFPAVRYLARMEQEHSRELKLRNRLLLILRLLAVLALAFAAARPIVRLLGLGHAPIAVALVVDNSMSSGLVRDGRTVFDSVRREAQGVLEALTADDRGWLIAADGRVYGGTVAALRNALADMRPLSGRGDLAASTRRAVALARSGAPRTPVVALVSDGQRSSFVADSAVDAGAVPVLAWLHGGLNAATRNAAIMAVEPTPVRWAPGGAVSFAVTAPDSANWRLALEQRTVARGRVPAAAPDAPARVSIKLASATTGWIRGQVELDPDALRADDTRWFAVRVAPPPAVELRGTAGPFLDAALATLIDEGRLTRRAAGTGTIVASADAAGTRLPVLLAAPADPVRLGEANRQLARLNIPWRFGAVSRAPVVARVPGADNDSTAPAVQAFEGTTVRLRYPLMPAGVESRGGIASAPSRAAGRGAADTIASAGGAPWVVAGPGYVLLGSPIDLTATDLPLRAAFVPWVLEALARRLGEDGRVLAAAPGATVTGLRDVDALERPDGTLQPIATDRITVPEQPGVYFLRREAARIGALVVNPEPEESDVVGMGAGSGDAGTVLPDFVRGSDVVAMRAASAWRTAIFDRAAGQALVLPLLALALLALLAEGWISGR